MEQPIYLNKEELEVIQSMNNQFMQMKMRIADIEMEKLDTVAQLEHMRQQFSSYEKGLIEKYGDDTIINVKTGEVTKKEKSKPVMELLKN